MIFRRHAEVGILFDFQSTFQKFCCLCCLRYIIAQSDLFQKNSQMIRKCDVDAFLVRRHRKWIEEIDIKCIKSVSLMQVAVCNPYKYWMRRCASASLL